MMRVSNVTHSRVAYRLTKFCSQTVIIKIINAHVNVEITIQSEFES